MQARGPPNGPRTPPSWPLLDGSLCQAQLALAHAASALSLDHFDCAGCADGRTGPPLGRKRALLPAKRGLDLISLDGVVAGELVH